MTGSEWQNDVRSCFIMVRSKWLLTDSAAVTGDVVLVMLRLLTAQLYVVHPRLLENEKRRRLRNKRVLY